jgi:hypothetical protein
MCLIQTSPMVTTKERQGERIERRLVELGKGKFMDSIIDCTLVECEIRIHRGASSVILAGSTFERCAFRPRREIKSLRFTTMTLRNCSFFGKYSGCRFGKEMPEQTPEIRDCDFSPATYFHLCDFRDVAELGSLVFPPWPHIVVTDLPKSRQSWLSLKFPDEMQIVQKVIGDSFSSAVTLFLPAETYQAESLRDLLASESYILIR